MGKITLNISQASQEDARTIENYFNGESAARQRSIANNYSNFTEWLKAKNPSIFYRVSHILKDIWEQISSALEDIADGIGRICATIYTPAVGLYEGIKEGMNNGFEAGVKKGFDAMGDFLDNLFE